MPDVTVSGYAQLRKASGKPGGSRQAIEKAIHAKRLVKCIVRTSPQILIDPYIADQEWEANTRKEAKSIPAPATPAPAPPASAGEVGGDLLRPDLNYEKARKAKFDADLADLNLQRARGDLVDVREAKALWFRHWRELRDRVLSVADEADGLVLIGEASALRHRLGVLLRQALDDLPQDPPA